MPDIIEELFKGFKKQKKMTKKKEEDDKEEEIPNFYLIQSLYLCFSYLKAMLTADSVFLYGNFSFFDLESLKVYFFKIFLTLNS